MTKTSITLHTKKEDANTLINVTKVSFTPEERGKTLKVTVLGDDDKTPYDLSNLSIRFVDYKDGDKIIVDDGTGDNPGLFIRDATKDKIGEFQYKLQSNALQTSGLARFLFYKGTDQIDSSNNFRIEIDRSIQLDVDNTSYVSDLSSLRTIFEDTINKAKEQVDDLRTAIVSDKKEITDEINNSKKQVDDLINKTKSQFDSVADQFNEIDELKKQLDSLKNVAEEINQDQKYQAAMQDQINKIDKQLTDLADKISNSDKKVATKADKDAVYTKDEVNSKIKDLKNGFPETPDLSAYETIADNDKKLSLKADTEAVISQIEKVKKDITDNLPKIDLSRFETIENIDNKLLKKADKDKVDAKFNDVEEKIASNQSNFSAYTKTEELTKELATKADSADVYSKKETDIAIDNKAADINKQMESFGKVKTVSINGDKPISPNEAGNVDIKFQHQDLSSFAKEVDITNLRNQLKATDAALNAANEEITKLKQRKLFTTFNTLAEAQDFMKKNPNAETIVMVNEK